jgi:hypothetical protein
LFAVSATLLLVGCDSAGTSPESPPDEPTDPGDDGGAVSFALARSADSNVPSDADSAAIRVWRPDGSYNLVRYANIPDPGQRTEVALDVPAQSGYRAGVLALTSNPKRIRAHGSSSTFDVQSGDTTQVDLNVRTADLTLRRPSALRPNRTDTITAVYGINPPDLGLSVAAEVSSNSTFNYFGGTLLSPVDFGETDSTETESFEITGPDVQTEDTTYVKVKVRPSPSTEDWGTTGREIVNSYFPSKSGPSFAIPVSPEEENGTIVITFSKDGNTWTKTRWPDDPPVR